MDSSQASSFIPKTPVRGAVNKRRVRKVYVITYLIYVFFLGTLLAAGATWFLKYSVEQSLTEVQSSLAEERNRFNQSDLSLVQELDQRMTEASQLLNSQVSVASVFEAIEDVTLASVNMTGFLYEKTINSSLVMTLNARAADFNTTQFQRQVLSANPVLAGSDIVSVEYGAQTDTVSAAVSDFVTFTISKTINPATVPPDTTANNFSVPSSDTMLNGLTDVSDSTSVPVTDEMTPVQ